MVVYKLTLDILELQMKSKKKKVLGFYYGSLQTYTRYSGVADEEQKKKRSEVFFKVVYKLTLDILELQLKSKKKILW